ncbi:MAG: hypothetical protein QM656_13205 [Paracoccaceae bacterium]
MRNRLRLAMVATALLYLGPLLAGLGGFGWGMVPAFLVIFTLWLIVMRPRLWPRDLAAWQHGEVVVAAAAQVAVQALLVVLCFGIGRGIGGAAGIVPMVSPLLPLALSLVAIPLTRLVWDPVQGERMDDFLEDAIRQVEDPSAQSLAGSGADAGVLAPVLDLPDHTPDADAEAAVARAMAAGAGLPESALAALVGHLDALDPPRNAARRGLVLWATRPGVLDSPDSAAVLHAGFAVTWSDAALLRLFAERACPLIEARPSAWRDFPDVAEIRYSMEEDNPDGLNEGLRALADRIEEAMPAGLRTAPDPA